MTKSTFLSSPAAEVADEVGGRGRVVGIDVDQHAVERRRCMHRSEGCLTVTIEAWRSVGRDHVREYPAGLRGLGSRRGGHGRDAKNGAETGCRQSWFPGHCFLPLVVGVDRQRHPPPRFPARHAGIQRRNAAARRKLAHLRSRTTKQAWSFTYNVNPAVIINE